MPPSPFSAQAESRTRVELSFDVSCLHITVSSHTPLSWQAIKLARKSLPGLLRPYPCIPSGHVEGLSAPVAEMGSMPDCCQPGAVPVNHPICITLDPHVRKAAYFDSVSVPQAFVGTAPLLALVSEDLHAHQIRDTRCQLPQDRTVTCGALRVRQ